MMEYSSTNKDTAGSQFINRRILKSDLVCDGGQSSLMSLMISASVTDTNYSQENCGTFTLSDENEERRGRMTRSTFT